MKKLLAGLLLSLSLLNPVYAGLSSSGTLTGNEGGVIIGVTGTFSGTVTANAFVGDGSGITNISASAVGGFTQGSIIHADVSGNLTEDNSNLFWDITNLRMGIGTASPDASSILTLSSTTAGFLPPVMVTATQNAITSPATGLSIFNSTLLKPTFYDGAAWRETLSDNDIGADVQAWSVLLDDIGGGSGTLNAFIVGTSGNFIEQTGSDVRDSAGLGTADSPEFTGLTLNSFAGALEKDAIIFTADAADGSLDTDALQLSWDSSANQMGVGIAQFVNHGILGKFHVASAFNNLNKVNTNADEVVIEGIGTSGVGLTIYQASGSVGTTSSRIAFSNASNISVGEIHYQQEQNTPSNDIMFLKVNASDRVQIEGDGKLSLLTSDEIGFNNGSFDDVLKSATTTAARTWTLPDTTGTVLLDVDVGTIASQDANNVSITGGSITGITDLAVADGGTGASTDSGARTNLGLVIGTDVQAWDAGLDDISGLAVTNSNIIVGDGANWVAESGVTARASLGVTIGTDVQAWDANLDDIAVLSDADSNFIVGSALGWVAESGATARTSLGLGSLAVQNTINNDDWSGTDLAIANGGTGSSTAGDARTALGLAIGTDVQAFDQNLQDISGLAVTNGNIIVGDGVNFVAESGDTARTSLGLGTGDSPTWTGATLSGLTEGSVVFSGASGVISEDNSNFFWDNTEKRLGIGTATPELSVDGDDGLIIRGTFGAGDTLTTAGAGTRAFFYPRKAAFRAGQVDGTQWDEGNIGINTIALGKNSKASVDGGIAIGTDSISSFTNNISIGLRAASSGTRAIAIGADSNGGGDSCLAIGRFAKADALGAMTFTSGDTTSTFNNTTPKTLMMKVTEGVLMVDTMDPTKDASAMLHIKSSTKGFLPPVMITATQNAIPTPAVGLSVFNSTLNKPTFYDNTAWREVLSDNDIGVDVQAWDAGLDDISGLAVTNGNIIVGDGANWVAESGDTARTSLGLGTGDSQTFLDLTLGATGEASTTLGFLSTNTGTNIINFGDSDSATIGAFKYDHTADQLSLTVEGTEAFTWNVNESVLGPNEFRITNSTLDSIARVSLNANSLDYFIQTNEDQGRFEILSSGASTPEFQIQDSTGAIGINGGPSADTVFQVNSTTKGSRLNNMTTAQRIAISSPGEGLIVYDTTLDTLMVYDGATWNPSHSDNYQGSVTNVGLNDTKIAQKEMFDAAFPMLKAGKIYALGVTLNDPRTAGTCTVQVLVNGVAKTAGGETIVIDATNTTAQTAVLSSPISFSAKDVIKVQTVTSGFNPVASDAQITVWTI